MPSSRVTTVQVPGEQPKDKPESENTGAAQPGEKPSDGQPGIDIEALRAEIRAEERARLHDELTAQMHVASTVIGKASPAGKPQRARGDFRHMHAADIDHRTLTAPVQTLDGWLCPPMPEPKK